MKKTLIITVICSILTITSFSQQRKYNQSSISFGGGVTSSLNLAAEIGYEIQIKNSAHLFGFRASLLSSTPTISNYEFKKSSYLFSAIYGYNFINSGKISLSINVGGNVGYALYKSNDLGVTMLNFNGLCYGIETQLPFEVMIGKKTNIFLAPGIIYDLANKDFLFKATIGFKFFLK